MFGAMWCRLMHREVMWPINGEYQCRTCLRKHRVVWEPVKLGNAGRLAVKAEVPAIST